MLTKVAISLPKQLLNQIDELARARQMSRSALVRQSLEALLREERQQATLARARQIYAEIAAEDKALAEKFQPLAAETLPPYMDEGEAS